MPDMNVNWTGDPTGAVAAAGEVQAAIDAVHGKTVEINVVSNGVGGAASDIGSVGRAADGAATSAARQAEASARAARATSEHGAAAERAGSGLRSFGADADRAARSAGALGDSTEQASRSMQNLGSGTDRASSSMRSLTSGSEGVSRAVGGVGKSFDDMWTAMAGGNAGAAPDWATGTAKAVDGVGASARSMSRFMSDASGETSRVSRDLVPLGSSADRAGSALERLGDRGGRGIMELSKGSDGVYRAISAVGKTLPDMSDGIDAASKTLPGLAKSMGSIGSVAGIAGTGLKFAGIAAGVSAIGMGALAAATAGVGLGAVIGDIAASGPMMNAAKKGVSDFTGEFKKMSGATATAGLQGMRALGAEAKDIGSTIAHMGVEHLPMALSTASGLGAQLNSTLKQLNPAIDPAITAVGAVGSALMGAIGNSGGQIAAFSNTVTAAAPGLQSVTESLVRGATALGGGLVQAVAASAPIVSKIADVAEGATDFMLGTVGIKSNYTTTPGPDGHKDPAPSLSNTIGNQSMAAGVQGFLSTMGPPVIGPALGAAAGWAIRQAGGGDVDAGQQERVATVGGGTMVKAPIAANPDMGEVAKPGQATFQPGQRFGANWDKGAPDEGPARIDPTVAGRPATNRAAEAAHQDTATPPPSQQTQQQQAAQQQAQAAVSRVGSSMGGGNLDNLRQQLGGVNSAMQATGQQAGMFGSQFASGMQQTQSAAMGGTSATQQAMQGARQNIQGAAQGVQQAAPQLQTAAQQAMSPLTQPPPPPPPAAAAAPVKQMATQVQEQAPAMASAGSDLGSSVGEGMGQGITKEITNTLTIVKKWITNIIDTGADMLGIASPSTVFYSFGQFTAQGFQGGLQSGAGGSVTAVQNMMASSIGAAQSVVNGASGQIMGGFGSQLQNSMQNALSPLTGQMQNGMQNVFDPVTGQQRTSNNLNNNSNNSQWFANQPKAGELNPADPNSPDPYKRMSGARGVSPAALARIEEAQKNAPRDAEGNSLYDSRADGLIGRMGMTPKSAEDLLARRDAHNKRADRLGDERRERHDAALARTHPELNTLGMSVKEQANAWRNSDMYNKGQWDPNAWMKEGKGAGPNTPEKRAALEQAKNDQQKAFKDAANPQAFNNSRNWLDNALGTERGPDGQISAFGKWGEKAGQAAGEGKAKGLKDTEKQVEAAAKQQAEKAAEKSKQTLGINSPSKVFHDIGLGVGEGMAAGVGAASDSVRGVASDRGLMVGYSWATSMVDGVASVMKKTDWQNAAFPQVENDLAKTVLGQLGLLGPAGSGASIWKTPMVSLGGNSGSSGTPVTVNLYTSDGQLIDQKIANAQDQTVNMIADSLGLQVG